MALGYSERMLIMPEALRAKMERVLDQASQTGADPQDIARQLIALDPLFAPARVTMAAEQAREGRLDEAEEQLWKALEIGPCAAFTYFALSQVRKKRDDGDVLAEWLSNLGVWKLALSDEIEDTAAEQMSGEISDETLDPHDPEVYEAMARAELSRLEENPLSENDQAALRRFVLLNKLQQEAPDVVAWDTMNGILKNAEECIPVLRGALRTWASGVGQVSEEAGFLIVALLGEIAGADVMEELMELADKKNGFLHVHWALHRMADRFPEDALAVFRKATAGAGASMRCAIADQICMMQPVPGIDEALIRLADHFSQWCRQPEAMPLLLAVVEGLRNFGNPEQAGSILARCRKMLKTRQRRMLDQAMENGLFVPRLVAEGADGADIEDVVIERILIEEDEDEDGDEDEFEDGEDDQARPETPVNRLMLRIADFMTERLTFEEMEEAKYLYFGTRDQVEVTQQQVDDFINWTILGFRGTKSGLTALELFLTEPVQPRLRPEERKLVEDLGEARYGLFEFLQVDRGHGVQARDVYTGQTEFVRDISFSKQSRKGDCFLTRTFIEGDRTEFLGTGTLVAPEIRPALHKWIAEESKAAGQPEADFVRANAYRVNAEVRRLHAEAFPTPQIVTPEGHKMEFSTATYGVTNPPEAIARLRKMEEIVENSGQQGELSFGWVEPGKGPRRALGAITITDRWLTLECTSRERLRRGRQLLELKLGPSVEHIEDVFQSLDEAMKKRRA